MAPWRSFIEAILKVKSPPSDEDDDEVEDEETPSLEETKELLEIVRVQLAKEASSKEDISNAVFLMFCPHIIQQ
jgi:hypothetical protein